jgi:hypothetical protein
LDVKGNINVSTNLLIGGIPTKNHKAQTKFNYYNNTLNIHSNIYASVARINTGRYTVTLTKPTTDASYVVMCHGCMDPNDTTVTNCLNFAVKNKTSGTNPSFEVMISHWGGTSMVLADIITVSGYCQVDVMY